MPRAHGFIRLHRHGHAWRLRRPLFAGPPYAAGAKRAATKGPVFITDRGRPAHVLLSIEHYRRLAGQQALIVDLLALPGSEDQDLPLPRQEELARAADLS